MSCSSRKITNYFPCTDNLYLKTYESNGQTSFEIIKFNHFKFLTKRITIKFHVNILPKKRFSQFHLYG